jgi:uncharacterized protein YjbK
MAGNDVESEVKLELLSDDPLAALTEALGKPIQKLEQLNRYFLPASPAGWVVRLREVDGALVLTVKGSESPGGLDDGSGVAGIFVRAEREARVASDFLLALLPDQDQAPLFELPPMHGLTGPLRPAGSCRNTRWMFPHAGLTLELDRTEYADGSTAWELEVESDRPKDALAAAVALLNKLAIPFRPSTRGKFARVREKLGKG